MNREFCSSLKEYSEFLVEPQFKGILKDVNQESIRMKVNAQVAIFSNIFPFKNRKENRNVNIKKPPKVANSDEMYSPEA